MNWGVILPSPANPRMGSISVMHALRQLLTLFRTSQWRWA